jgi:hypothetical protein
MEEEKNLETSLVTTLQSDEAVSIASDLAEVAIDAALDDGVLKDIPIVGSLVSLTKIGFTVRDRLFVAKLLKFLSGLHELKPDERKSMVDKLESDADYGRRVGEHLIEIIERIDSHRKPYMTAKVFAAYVGGTINASLLHRLNFAIERMAFYEIDAVRVIDQKWKALKQENPDAGIIPDVSVATLQALQGAGLLEAVSGWGALVYRPNDLTEVFLNLDLDGTDD